MLVCPERVWTFALVLMSQTYHTQATYITTFAQQFHEQLSAHTHKKSVILLLWHLDCRSPVRQLWDGGQDRRLHSDDHDSAL